MGENPPDNQTQSVHPDSDPRQIAGRLAEQRHETRPTQIGPYRILQTLGEGGMGVVYLAEQTKPIHRRVALKVVKLGMDTKQVIARFETEREALALMNHPNVAKVFDAGATETGRPYFVMEYVPGIPITDYCDRQRLSTEERLRLFMDVCHAVQHAHQKGIIHRDIKPSNILIAVDSAAAPLEKGGLGGVQVKVIDFGVAKATQHRLTERTVFTEQGQLIGTPGYMSPEQAEMTALDIDTRTDVYSLGVVLYELLVGALPFDPQSLRQAAFGEIQRIIREVEPPKPSTRLSMLRDEGTKAPRHVGTEHVASPLVGGAQSVPRVSTSGPATPEAPESPLPHTGGPGRSSIDDIAHRRHTEPKTLIRQIRGDLDWIVMKCLEKDRTRRYDTANALAAEIARYLNNEPVLAGPPSVTYRFRKFVRRNRASVIAGGLVTAVFIMGIVGTSTGLFWALREQKRAVAAAAAEADARMVAERRTTEAEFAGYLANISAAQSALNEGTPISARRRLDACPEALRNWEWKHLSALSDGSLYILRGHGSEVFSAAFSPDGTRVVTASNDTTARLWDAATGQEVAVLRGHSALVSTAAFSPDGTRVLTASWDTTARLWDAGTGKEVAIQRGQHARVTSAAFSQDGTRVVTASEDTTARLWDAAMQREFAVLRGHDGLIWSVAFSPDGTRVVSASEDKTARLWDVATGQEVLVLRGHAGPVRSAAFSPGGTLVVTASQDQTARLWDAGTGQEVIVLRGHSGAVMSAAFSPDGTRVVTASADGTARLWDAATGQEVAVMHGHGAVVRSAAFSPGGTRVVTASEDTTARLWDATAVHEVVVLRGHSDRVMSAFSPDGMRVVTARDDQSARLWDAATGREILVLRGHAGNVLSAAFSPDGARVVSASADKTARLWDAVSGTQVVVLRGHSGPVWSAVFSPDGTRVFTASEDRTARLWDASTGHEVADLGANLNGTPSAVFNPDSTRVVTTSPGRFASLWDTRTGQRVGTLSGDDTKGIGTEAGGRSAMFSPDGEQVVAAWLDRTARSWDATTRKKVAVLRGHSGDVLSAAFSPDGTRVVTASDDQTARMWDAATGQEVLVLRGHSRPVRSAAFSPDGARVLTESEDGTVRVYDSVPWHVRFQQNKQRGQ